MHIKGLIMNTLLSMIKITLIMLVYMASFIAESNCDLIAKSDSVILLPSTINIPRDTPVGTVIFYGMYDGYKVVNISCYGHNTWGVSFSKIPELASGFSDVYKTSFDGVGIRVKADNQFNSYAYTVPFSFGFNAGTFTPRGSFYIELIVTGPIQSGTLNLSASQFGQIYQSYGGIMTHLLNFTPSSVYVSKTSCTITAPSINVNLGNWTISDFNGVGSTAAAKPLRISLSCDSGVKIKASINGRAETSQAGVLKLTEGHNSATGFGVQLLDDDNKLLTLNTKFTAGIPLQTGLYTLNWQARYIQTAAIVTPGKANAMATLELTYE